MRDVKAVTVAELIEHLKTLPANLPVAYRCYSETVLLGLLDIQIDQLQPPRPDGWVHDKRPDKEAIDYVVLPGN